MESPHHKSLIIMCQCADEGGCTDAHGYACTGESEDRVHIVHSDQESGQKSDGLAAKVTNS